MGSEMCIRDRVMTTIIVVVVKAIVPLRVESDDEEVGLDQSEHGEKAYDLSS